MRFGILTQYYPPEMGAPQARLSELAARFAERGHQVSVLTAMPNYPAGKIQAGYAGLFRREICGSVNIMRCWIYPSSSVHLFSRLASYGSFSASSAALGALLLPRLDYLLTESPPLFLGASGCALARLKGARWIFNVSDLWPESAVRLGVIGPGAALRMAERLEAWCYRKAWLVSGQSRGILSDIQARFPGVPTYHLSNGADPSWFTRGSARSPWRERLAGPEECLILYAGLHGIAQGLDQVLEAARRIGGHVRARFVLAGDGPEKPRLVALARELGLANVQFLDPVPRAEIPALLHAADIAVVPLKLALPGAVPSKLYEAMAAGVPVVLVGEGEPAAIVRETESGIAVDPGDAAGLEGALRKLAGDAGFRAECGAHGRRAAAARFDRKRIADAFIMHLEQHLPDHQARESARAAAPSALEALDRRGSR